jgi:hypothetical protein
VVAGRLKASFGIAFTKSILALTHFFWLSFIVKSLPDLSFSLLKVEITTATKREIIMKFPITMKEMKNTEIKG